jgi:glycerol dehydrogenase-like iron-containing ADH family enzyme
MFSRVLMLTCILSAGPKGIAADTEVPSQAPRDAVMAGPSEVAEMTHWVSQALARAKRSDTVRRAGSAGRPDASTAAVSTTFTWKETIS